MSTEEVTWDRSGPVLVAMLNRPEQHNAVSPAMLNELTAGFDDFAADDGLRAAVLTGAGNTFCAGGDIAQLIPKVVAEGLGAAIPDPGNRVFSSVYKPIIAAINGSCMAGGIELMLGTDIRIAAPHAQFATPEVSWGFVGAGGICARLARQIPWAAAMELLLTGRPIDAQRAYELGLINRIVPADRVFDEAVAMAERVASMAPLAIRATKEAVVRGADLRPAYEMEWELSETVFASADAREGLRAFAEHRAPAFAGR